MGSIKSIPMTIDECCADITTELEKKLTRQLLELFTGCGGTYLVSATNPQRIYCYVKKSKESLIINKISYTDRVSDGGYSLQLRITSEQTFGELDSLSENIRGCILGGRVCKAPCCCNCGHEYVFEYNGRSYRKCHMLCDNFMLTNIGESDISSVLRLAENEIQNNKKAVKSK